MLGEWTPKKGIALRTHEEAYPATRQPGADGIVDDATMCQTQNDPKLKTNASRKTLDSLILAAED